MRQYGPVDASSRRQMRHMLSLDRWLRRHERVRRTAGYGFLVFAGIALVGVGATIATGGRVQGPGFITLAALGCAGWMLNPRGWSPVRLRHATQLGALWLLGSAVAVEMTWEATDSRGWSIAACVVLCIALVAILRYSDRRGLTLRNAYNLVPTRRSKIGRLKGRGG